MYLKSLTLKGFKSFADRAHMVFEPGLTVVVGPNGSGKSNISDAILWVLGEQSAKQLRGQAMEDVIFSGSSARKPVSVAEVTLVLDNSDRTLPVDFNEVAITRRMYRSGESEYLINASPCRLMDIQDILHDSGLGKETHSIISQGKLDAILQSRPEERRSLIEEAAGISKHKRRKERSLRKIKSMDEHLTRARDINREIRRQLRPLERQVERARKHKELTARAQELTTVLAVDDLRRLQEQWAGVETRAKEAQAAIEVARYRADEKDRELEKLQVMLEKKGLFVGDLGEQRRRMQDVVTRLGSDMRLLEEKGRNMAARLQELRGSLSGSEHQQRRIAGELEDVRRELEDVRGAADAAADELMEAEPEAERLRRARTELDALIGRIGREAREQQRAADSAALELAKVRETLANAEVEDSLYASRIDQLTEAIENAEASLASRRDRAEELAAELEETRRTRDEAKQAVSDASDAVVAARNAETEARRHLSEVQVELSSLEKLDRQASAASPLAAHVERARADVIRARIGGVIEVPRELEQLVEGILGEDVDAFVVADAEALADVAACAEAAQGSGHALVISQTAEACPAPDAPGYQLMDKLVVRPGFEGAVGALLGNLRVVGSLDEALAAPAVDGVVYVTPDGTRVSCGAVVRVGTEADKARGVLERKRRIRELGELLPELEEASRAASTAVDDAQAALAAARERVAEVAGSIAAAEGELKAVRSDVGRLDEIVRQSTSERAQVERRRAEAGEAVRAAQPKLEELSCAREDAEDRAAALNEELDEKSDEMARARLLEADAQARLSEIKVRSAQAAERLRNLERREPELANRLAGIERRIRTSSGQARSLEVLRLRVDPLRETYRALLDCAEQKAAHLRDRSRIEEADSDSLKRTIEGAKAEARSAHDELERANASQHAIEVERGRLEVQVENAVRAITQDGAVILEEALKLPAPDDRAAAERELGKLTAQISNLGPVNQVAMEEYDRLKERADYIEVQLKDLESARSALTKISAAIDRKMRRQFLVTFEKVDRNFQEIFGMLFPGGTAHLEMTDPDHPSETGIEVVAQPRGKRITKMMLMSGGEKSLTALALLFAVYRTRTVPFYVLDEVEAALDDSNLSKLLDAIDVLRHRTQLIVISHQRRTMEDADVLYGVSMQADGVSRVVSQKLDRIKQGGVR